MYGFFMATMTVSVLYSRSQDSLLSVSLHRVHVVFSTTGLKGGGKRCPKTRKTTALRKGIQKSRALSSKRDVTTVSINKTNEWSNSLRWDCSVLPEDLTIYSMRCCSCKLISAVTVGAYYCEVYYQFFLDRAEYCKFPIFLNMTI